MLGGLGVAMVIMSLGLISFNFLPVSRGSVAFLEWPTSLDMTNITLSRQAYV